MRYAQREKLFKDSASIEVSFPIALLIFKVIYEMKTAGTTGSLRDKQNTTSTA